MSQQVLALRLQVSRRAGTGASEGSTGKDLSEVCRNKEEREPGLQKLSDTTNHHDHAHLHVALNKKASSSHSFILLK